MLLPDLDGYEFSENAQFGEVLARSVLRFDKTLMFPQWLKISLGRGDVLDVAKTAAKFDLDDAPPLYRNNSDYRAAVEHLRQRFPNLLGFSPAVTADLEWMANACFGFGYWPTFLPQTEQEQLTSPAEIRSQFKKYRASLKR